MQKLIRLTTVLLILISVEAWKKENVENNSASIPTEYIKATINPNSIYTYNLGSFGDEEGASISNQPSSFRVSKLQRTDGVNVIYTYIPQPKFTGTVNIELQASLKRT